MKHIVLEFLLQTLQSPLFLCWNLIMVYLVLSNIVGNMTDWNPAHLSVTCTIIIIFQKDCTHNLSPKWQLWMTSVLFPTIEHRCKRSPPPLFHPNPYAVFGNVLIQLANKTHTLVVTMELIWVRDVDVLSINLTPATN